MSKHRVTGGLRKVDERVGFASSARTVMAKVFPDHWSFMLGEIALYSFVVLVFTGVYLSIFFDPSTSYTTYTGSYHPLTGHQVSSAYATTVAISWDVRGGLLMRQTHHWAAHIFVGSLLLHLFRVFFTGSFRKPRELNWMIGVGLFVLALLAGFSGYTLPDDLLSGIALRVFYGTELSIPIIGGWVGMFTFGGDFPGDSIIYRLYALHVVVVPALIAILIAVHLGLVIRQRQSQFRGQGRSETNVVGSRLWPTRALRSLALMSLVAAVTFLAGGLAQINPIWVWGDFSSPTVLAPSSADWYEAWIEGAYRLFPSVNVWIAGRLIPQPFWPGVLLPGLTIVVLFLWPFIDRKITGDRGTHHLAASPRDSPIRTAIGVTAISFYSILLIAAGEELIDEWSLWPISKVRAMLRAAVLVVPLIAGSITYLLARTLKASGKEGLLNLSWRDFRIRRSEKQKSEPATGESFPGPTWSEPTVPGVAVPGEAIREEPVPGVPLALEGAPEEPEPAEPAATERPLSEVPTWLKRSRSEERR